MTTTERSSGSVPGPRRSLLTRRPCQGHSWVLVADESDDFGRVRAYECDRCNDVRYE